MADSIQVTVVESPIEVKINGIVTGVSEPEIQIVNFTDGPKGDAATIQIGTVTTGALGDSAEVHNSGDTHDAVFDFVLPSGPRGDAATLNVGTTTTVTGNNNAAVNNSGNENDAVFDFIIPKGISVASINKTSSANFIDTYEITSDIGTVLGTFTVTNGQDVDHISGPSTAGYVDTYTFWQDADETVSLGTFTISNAIVDVGSTTTTAPGTDATVTNSSNDEHSAVFDFTIPRGDGIANISKTGTAGLVDTYTVITNTGVNVGSFTITNADDIDHAKKINTVGTLDTYELYLDADENKPCGQFTVKNVNLVIGTTTTGNAGTNASVNNSGTVSDPILDFIIPQGAAATISVGNTSISEPGTNAQVSNSGTTEDAVLDFIIPKGDGIASVTKTNTVELVDTYTVTTNTGINAGTFTITNADDVDHATRTSGNGTAGTIDTYTLYLDAAETKSCGTFTVYNGADGQGSGDMLKSVYDPNTINADVFDRANHTGTQTASTISDFDTEVANNSAVTLNTAKRSYPSEDETKLAGIETGAEVNVNADWNATSGDAEILNKPVTITSSQATEITANTAKRSYPSTDETKLAGIEENADVTDATNVAAAGATMNVDTDVSGNSWVLNEDDMSSDSATKVPTQQSVKAYSMGVEDYKMTAGRIMNPLLHLPLKNGFNMPHGTGSVTFIRATTATYIDRYGVVQNAAIDEARFEKEGLLIEGSSTNKFIYSEDFSNSAWGKSQCTIGGSVTLPNGSTGTVNKIIEDTSTSLHGLMYSTASISSQTVTFSLFAKKDERDILDMWLGDGTGNNFVYYFNLSDGVITFSGRQTSIWTNISANIKECANGWYRCSITGTIDSAYSSVSCRCYLGNDTTIYSYGVHNYTGDGFSGLYVWGAQLEELPFASSYIPTTSAAVTRSADVCTITYASNIPNYSDESTILVDFNKLGYGKTYDKIYRIQNATHFAQINQNTNTLYCVYTNSYLSKSINLNQVYRLGSVFDGSKMFGYLDGTKEGSVTPTSIPSSSGNVIYLGCAYDNIQQLYGHISNFRIYDIALTEEEMKIA